MTATPAARRRRGPRPTSVRLRGLLVMLPWLMEQGEVPIADMARRFRLTEKELIADLELAAMCGLPPFVDEMIDVFVDDDGMAVAGVPRVFTKPLRLAAPEAFALVAAARAALELPGAEPDGALARALTKLEAALGDPELQVELDAPDLTDELTAAVASGEVLLIRYWVASREETTDRRIAPRSVFSDRGRWYLLADDLGTGPVADTADPERRRTFRIDRIEALEHTNEYVELRPGEPPREWFADDDVTVARVRLAAPAVWAAERYPVRDVRPLDGGGVEVELAVASERWLARLLLRLGPDAEVLDPPAWRDLGARTAAGVLARYGP